MSDLSPVAFDIETSGLDRDAVVTVAGFSHELGHWLFLNTAGRTADEATLTRHLETESRAPVSLEVVATEQALLEALSVFAEERIDGDSHYLTAYNGETWNGGFDLPFLRSACHRNGVSWPFGDLAYADMMEVMSRFDTGDTNDLVGVYDLLIGADSCDPFTDSKSAVAAFEAGDWQPLLQHNLADITRTRELAELAGRFVPRSDFQMKNLEPPQ
ncbi:hypothetical protein [Salinibaculum rarum]|uniref:hypothetical protein n=1 Tax=Salinibaculum rarum TaxID=3058903 RepID=UPI00266014BB|nr:hypothetical protein [Salinibaculum sp. KK48]